MSKDGYSRKGFFGETIHYDGNGKKIGESRPGFWGGTRDSGMGVMGGSAARRSDSTRHRGGGENEDSEWIEDHGYDPEDFDL